MIEVTESERGFHIYGGPIVCTYGSTVRVYESSAVTGPHLWVKVEQSPQLRQFANEGTLHLNPEQARQLVEQIQRWLDEIPERWGEEPTDIGPQRRIVTLHCPNGHALKTDFSESAIRAILADVAQVRCDTCREQMSIEEEP